MPSRKIDTSASLSPLAKQGRNGSASTTSAHATTTSPRTAVHQRALSISAASMSGERVRSHEPIALEERARAFGRRLIVEADLWKQRGRGHRSSFLMERTKRASAGRRVAMPV
jgi:hypothetical protein